MKDKDLLQKYINNFRREISPYLKPNIGLKSKVHPSDGEGAILEFELAPGIENDDEYEIVTPSLGLALKDIEQHAFGGQLENISFKGTNVILENNRIILVKGEDQESQWSEQAVMLDLARVLPKKGKGK